MKRVAVGLSGGVDSAVSAWLLKKEGFEVVGVHLYCWPPKSEVERDGLTREEWIKKNGCRADEDRAAALKTALELSIPFQVLDFSEGYNQRVVDYFYREYEVGRTPNPDVLCNSEIKFGLFLKWALDNRFDYVATGHYAKLVDVSAVLTTVSTKDILDLPATSFLENGNVIESSDSMRPVTQQFFSRSISGGHAKTALRSLSKKDVTRQSFYRLQIPKDKHKDQTYFLWKLTQKELAHVLFPLGDYLKTEVREMALKAGLSVAKRPDSQGICFIGNVDVKRFLARRLIEKPGEVVNVKGEVIGKHKGVWFYTIGERGGWELTAKAQKKIMGKGETPIFYVIEKDAKNNRLIVGTEVEATKNSFLVSEVNGELNSFGKVRIRHGGELLEARMQNRERRVEVVLDKEQRGIASGQSAVFYNDHGIVIGGGVIE